MSSAVKKIHPYDAYLLLTSMKTIDLIKKGRAEALPEGQFTVDGVLYQETTEAEPSALAREHFAAVCNS